MEYEQARNLTLLFFFERLIDKNEPRTLHDLSCQFGAPGFTKEMRQIAGGSESGELSKWNNMVMSSPYVSLIAKYYCELVQLDIECTHSRSLLFAFQSFRCHSTRMSHTAILTRRGIVVAEQPPPGYLHIFSL
jgi:hypothetical protein